jgi:hypothetical protein
VTLDRMKDLHQLAEDVSDEFAADLAKVGVVWVTGVRVSFDNVGGQVHVRLTATAGVPTNVRPGGPVSAGETRVLGKPHQRLTPNSDED